jgi:hypothetical protein
MEAAYGATPAGRKTTFSFRGVKVGDVILTKKKYEFFKVTEVSSINLIIFKINFIELDFYWNCL